MVTSQTSFLLSLGVVYSLPERLVDIKDSKVLIVDDVADTGHTLKHVLEFCKGQLADTKMAVLYEKSQSIIKCDFVWKHTDLWINFPWSDKDPVAQRKWSVKDA